MEWWSDLYHQRWLASIEGRPAGDSGFGIERLDSGAELADEEGVFLLGVGCATRRRPAEVQDRGQHRLETAQEGKSFACGPEQAGQGGQHLLHPTTQNPKHVV